MIPASNIEFLRSQARYLTVYEDTNARHIPRDAAVFRDMASSLAYLLTTPVHSIVTRFASDIPSVQELIENHQLAYGILEARAELFPELDALIRKFQGPFIKN